MNRNPTHCKKPTSQIFAGRSTVDEATRKKLHASHRIRQVKIRGLIMNLPGTDSPVEVCVNDQADWELIYKNPAVHVKCIISSCDTLLTAKRMSKSGLRFLAVRSGGCNHVLVEMPVEPDEIIQDPTMLDGGGGPEGLEHLWIKGRLYRIVRSLGAKAVVEHSPTYADVFLPEYGLVLEYQRWDTDFAARTQQRAIAGAARTIWMFPPPPEGPPTSLRKKISKEVFQNGGIYVSVLNPSDRYTPQRPWQNPSQERTARLFASGSIAEFDPDRQALIYKSRSLAAVLDEILSGERVLRRAPIWKKNQRRLESAPVWALREDHDRANAAYSRRTAPEPATSSASVTEAFAKPQSGQEHRTGTERAIEMHDQRMCSEVPTSATPAGRSPDLTETANTEVDPIDIPNSAVDVDESTPQQAESKNVTTEQPAPPRTLWKKIVDWLRQR